MTAENEVDEVRFYLVPVRGPGRDEVRPLFERSTSMVPRRGEMVDFSRMEMDPLVPPLPDEAIVDHVRYEYLTAPEAPDLPRHYNIARVYLVADEMSEDLVEWVRKG